MGCCASRPRDNDNPSAAAALPSTPSSRNITAPSTRHGSTPSPAPPTDTNGRPNAALRPIPADQRSKLPATLASPVAKSSHRVRPLTDSTNLTWTRARLEQERTDWWDTQVTGSAEIWGAIRIAAQHLQAGEVAEAQTMLDAAGCTCPSGALWKGVYDPTGVLYKVPEWLVVEPEGLAAEDDQGGSGGVVREASGAAGQGQAEADAEVEAQAEAEAETDEGAELEIEKDQTATVRIRTSHDQKDVVVHIRQRETVGGIVQKLRQQTELPPSTRVKLVYGGRPYHDHEMLSANTFWNFANAHTLVALVLEGAT